MDRFKKYYKEKVDKRNYKDVVQASEISRLTRKLVGMSVFNIISNGHSIIPVISLLGVVCHVLWYFLFIYCSVEVYSGNESIFRAFYKSKLKHYGENSERISCIMYFIYGMWKLPISFAGNVKFVKIFLDTDREIKKFVQKIDFAEDAYSALTMAAIQSSIFIVRLASVWISMSVVHGDVPIHRIVQVFYMDGLAFTVATHFCWYVVIVKRRYNIVNNVLNQIQMKKAWEHKMFYRGALANPEKAQYLQDKYLCERINQCARVYSLIYKSTKLINENFGYALLLTYFYYMFTIILCMFYLMEATGAGLIYHHEKYYNFVIIIFWQVGYAIAVIYYTVYTSNAALCEGEFTSYRIHKIINSNLSPGITAEAMKFSIQMLHEKPKFTTCVFDIDYMFLLSAGRSISTFLVVLLQFAY